MPTDTSTFALCFAGGGMLILLVVHVAGGWRPKHSRLPPGPKPLPFVGNILDMPRGHLGRGFADLAIKYGDIMHLNVLGKPFIVLGSYDTSRELLHKRSAIYSDRLQTVMGELSGLSNVLLGPKKYGPLWRSQRRAFHQTFNSLISPRYHHMQSVGTHRLLLSILESPHGLLKNLKSTFDMTVMWVVYGIVASEADEEYHEMIERLLEAGEGVLTPGHYLVDVFPFLQFIPAWLPGGGFKRYASHVKGEMNEISGRLLQTAKERMHTDTGRDSVLPRLLQRGNSSKDIAETRELDRICTDVGVTAYLGGTDTTLTSTNAFFLAMVMYPEVQQKAQLELDAIVGSDRLPDFSDRPSLPYFNALMKELYRWHVVTPIGLPHLSIADDEFQGYCIPAGSVVFPNVWYVSADVPNWAGQISVEFVDQRLSYRAMSRDNNRYPDPETFKPERFLDPSGKLNLSAGDPEDYIFGFGRRICPGRHFADSSIFIICASIIHAFNIKPPVDEHDVPVELKHGPGTAGAVSHVELHDYVVEARSPNVEQLVRSAISHDAL